MVKHVFEPVYDKRGIYGLQCKECKAGITEGSKQKHQMVLMVWRSPYASAERNYWLEKQLRKIYTQYYLKVLVDNMGYFW